MRDYIDRIFAESSKVMKVTKKRNRIRDKDFYDKEQVAPFQAPRWILFGYQGTLNNAVQQACSERSTTQSSSLPTAPKTNDTSPIGPQLKHLCPTSNLKQFRNLRQLLNPRQFMNTK